MATRLHGQMAAFTKADLMALVAVVTLVGGWFGCARLGERGRTSACARNLAVLGQATHSWANDHGGCIMPDVRRGFVGGSPGRNNRN